MASPRASSTPSGTRANSRQRFAASSTWSSPRESPSNSRPRGSPRSNSSVTSKPLRSVAADSNVLLSAAVGHAARRVFEGAQKLLVVTTEANLAEVQAYLPSMAQAYGLDLVEVQEAF